MSASEAAIRAAASAVLARDGWRVPGWRQIADEAGVTMAEVMALYPDPCAVLRDWVSVADRAMLSDLGPDETGGPAHDRLFALLMRRYDALTPYRLALRSVASSKTGVPAYLATLLPLLERSMLWALAGAGLQQGGWRDLWRAALLVSAHGGTFRVWLEDGSEDLGQTMSELDRQLKRIARYPGFVRRSKTLDDPISAAA